MCTSISLDLLLEAQVRSHCIHDVLVVMLRSLPNCSGASGNGDHG